MNVSPLVVVQCTIRFETVLIDYRQELLLVVKGLKLYSNCKVLINFCLFSPSLKFATIRTCLEPECDGYKNYHMIRITNTLHSILLG